MLVICSGVLVKYTATGVLLLLQRLYSGFEINCFMDGLMVLIFKL